MRKENKLGQYAGFVARYIILEEEELLIHMYHQGITEFTTYPELSLIVGIVKGGYGGEALTKLRMCGLEEIRMLGQLHSSEDDYPMMVLGGDRFLNAEKEVN